MPFTATCGKCGKLFDKDTKGKPYRNQQAADQALNMHKGRVHSKTIPTYAGGPRRRLPELVASNGTPGNTIASFEHVERRGRKGKLSPEQMAGIINFIQTRRNDFPTKTACFTAALEETGVGNLIRNNSVAVARYFAKAEGKPGEYAKRVKRKYTRRNSMALAVVDDSAQLIVSHRHGTLVKQCPRCGLVIDGAEDIFQLLQESPEIVHLALAAARKMHARKIQQLTP